jgi:hypothetical protein
MKVQQHTVYTITHRGTLTQLAQASSEEEVDHKIELNRRGTDPFMPDKIKRYWREPLSVSAEDFVTVSTTRTVKQPGAARPATSSA